MSKYRISFAATALFAICCTPPGLLAQSPSDWQADRNGSAREPSIRIVGARIVSVADRDAPKATAPKATATKATATEATAPEVTALSDPAVRFDHSGQSPPIHEFKPIGTSSLRLIDPPSGSEELAMIQPEPLVGHPPHQIIQPPRIGHEERRHHGNHHPPPTNGWSAQTAHPIPHLIRQHAEQPSAAVIPHAIHREVWKSPFSYGYFGASGKSRWIRHYGYRDRDKEWRLR